MLLSSSLVDYIRSEHILTTCFLNLLTKGIKLAQLIKKASCLMASVTETSVSDFFFLASQSHLCVNCNKHSATRIVRLADVPKKRSVAFKDMERSSTE
jgi:hypothetical protein